MLECKIISIRYAQCKNIGKPNNLKFYENVCINHGKYIAIIQRDGIVSSA